MAERHAKMEPALPFSSLIRKCSSHLSSAAEGHLFHSLLAKGELPREAYVEFLGQFYLVHHVLENHLRALRARRSDIRLLVEEMHFHEVNLRHDLVFFRRPPVSVRKLPATVRTTNMIERLAREWPFTLLGFHYVMQASQHGSRSHIPGLRESYELPQNKGTCYYDISGVEADELWQRFTDVLDSVNWTEEERSDIIEGVRLAYECYCSIIGDVVSHYDDEEDD